MSLLAVLPLALSAQVPGQMSSVGKWRVVDGNDACGIAAVYTDDAPKVLIFMVKEQRTDLLIMSLSSTAWSNRADAQYDLTVDFDGQHYEVEASGSRGDDGGMLMTHFDRSTLDLVAAAQTIEVTSQGLRLARMSLSGSGAAVRRMKSCIARMPAVAAEEAREHAEEKRLAVDPFAAIAPKVPRKVSGPADWLTNDDYPASALNAGASGTVGYRFTVNEQGRIEGCAITRSSGDAALDRATCSALTRRGRYTPSERRTVEGEHRWEPPSN